MDYRFGIDEDFFVCDDDVEIRARANEAFISRAVGLSGEAVQRGLLQSQISIETPICATMEQARGELGKLRGFLGRAARETGRTVLAAGTHPTAKWSAQERSPKQRYDTMVAELQMLAQRNLVCGMQVTVEIEDPEILLSVMRRSLPFLPIIQALACSSPFWQSRKTGFSSYRLTCYNEMPRAGLPPLFDSHGDYMSYVGMMEDAGIIPDASYLWWVIRPSHKRSALELRIADACTYLEDTLTIAALFRCLVRRLVEHRTLNAEINSPGRAIVKENKWRAQRFGIRADFVDPFGGFGAMHASDAVRRLVELIEPDAVALGCVHEIERVENILRDGTSADVQVALYDQALAAGTNEQAALFTVLSWLQRETLIGTNAQFGMALA